MALNRNTKAGSLVGSLIIGGGVRIKKVAAVSVAINPGANIPANDTFTSTAITVAGAKSGDVVIATPPSTIEDDLTWSSFVSADNAVKVRIANPTVGAVTTANLTWKILVFRLV